MYLSFIKANNTRLNWVVATTDGAGLVTTTVDSTVNEFFSSMYESMLVEVKDQNQDPVKFQYNSDEYDCIELPFSPEFCGLASAAKTLQVDTSVPCDCN